MALIGFFGLRSLTGTSQELNSMYRENLVPSNVVNRMMFLLADNRSQIMLALQHDATNPFVKMHDHPLDLHINATLKNREEINSLLETMQKQTLTDTQKALLDKFSESREKFSKEGVNAARGLLTEGKFSETNVVLLTKINPLYGDLRRTGEALIQQLSNDAEARYIDAEKEYASVRNMSIGLIAFAVDHADRRWPARPLHRRTDAQGHCPFRPDQRRQTDRRHRHFRT
jgi:aerotaxis receptor